jgi:exosortase N
MYSVLYTGSRKHLPAYLAAGILVFALYYFLKVQSLFILGFACFLMYALNATAGKTNSLPLFVAVAALPVTATLLNLISFDLRLLTTRLVVFCLHLLTQQVYAEGNTIHFRQHEYGVDDVCSGITMLQTGIIMALMLIAFFEKKENRPASVLQIVWLGVVACGLIFISNIFRIFIVVIFALPANTVTHEAAGIVAMIVYFALPFYFIVMKAAGGFPTLKPDQAPSVSSTLKYLPLVLLLTSTTVIYSALVLKNKRQIRVDSPVIPGYTLTSYEYGVAQYSNAKALLYVKPDVAFYAADHHPRLCWKGGGFQFTKEKYLVIRGHTVVSALLINQQGEQLYSAYWFQSGQHITSDELKWRWNALVHGSVWKMINITTSTLPDLYLELDRWLPK